jgi:arylsulfatase A-like enzyme
MNILLVVLDTARRDALEPYGAPAGSTPTLAGLARRGSALDQAYATASWTLPSHASMFTGLLPRALGLGQPPEGTPQGARPVLQSLGERLLPAVLRRAGYHTHGISTNLWISEHTGFDTGFESFRYVVSGRQERMQALLGQGPRAQLAWVREGLRAASDDGAAEAVRELRGLIDAWDGRPSFWFMNLSECHSPYLPPRPWNDLPPAGRVRAALEARVHLNFKTICLQAAGLHQVPEAALARMRHLYARSVLYMDTLLAGVLETLDRKHILDETLVVVTSDHGENFGEGGLIAHGFSVDQRLVHVPLVSAGPVGLGHGDGVFSLASLPAALAEAAGVTDHPYDGAGLPEGAAIAQYDPMGRADDPRIVEVAPAWGLDASGIERICATYTCATDGRLKLTVRDGYELVHDLGSDPDEQAPLDPASRDLTRLRAALAEAEAPTRSAVAGPQAGEPQSPVPTDADAVAIERQMKLLGYM